MTLNIVKKRQNWIIRTNFVLKISDSQWKREISRKLSAHEHKDIRNISLTKTRITELWYNNISWSPTKCLFLFKKLPFQQIPLTLKYQLNAMKIQRIWYVAFKKKIVEWYDVHFTTLAASNVGKRRGKRKELSKDREGMLIYTMVKVTVFLWVKSYE